MLSVFRPGFRQQRKDLFSALIGFGGFVLGLSTAILLFLYARNELSYETGYANADRIHIIQRTTRTPAGQTVESHTWYPLRDQLLSEFPQVERVFRFTRRRMFVQAESPQRQAQWVHYADPEMLSCLDVSLVSGDTRHALEQPMTVLVSRSYAERRFHTADAIGRTMTMNFELYHVAGVFEDFPANTVFQPEILTPVADRLDYGWRFAPLETYVMLRPETDPAEIDSGLMGIVENAFGTTGPKGTENMTLTLSPLREIHLARTGNRNYISAYFIMAVLLFGIALLNFTNLIAARSLQRIHEMGVRKVLGASRGRLLRSLMIEAVYPVSLIVGLAVLLSTALLPWVERTFGLELIYMPRWIIPDGISLLLLIAGSTLVAAVLPASSLLGVEPTQALKGNYSPGWSKSKARDAIIILQFMFSLFFIFATLTVWQQFRYMLAQDMQFNGDQVVTIQIPRTGFESRDEAPVHLLRGRDALLELPEVNDVAFSYWVPGDRFGFETSIVPENTDSDQPYEAIFTSVDDHYFPLYQIGFLEGGNFDLDREADALAGVIINESLRNSIGWSSAVGRTIEIFGERRTVLGVVRDYNYEALTEEIKPVIHIYEPSASRNHDSISIRIQARNLPESLKRVQSVWQQVDPDREFNYRFVDDYFAEQYMAHRRFGVLTTFCGIVAVLIACMGLLGMVYYYTTLRTRELGIRKVLGATESGLFMRLSADFLKRIALAVLIASPYSWWLLDRWLEQYAYRIEVGAGLVAASALITGLLAWITIGVRVLHAARINPVVALRNE